MKELKILCSICKKPMNKGWRVHYSRAHKDRYKEIKKAQVEAGKVTGNLKIPTKGYGSRPDTAWWYGKKKGKK